MVVAVIETMTADAIVTATVTVIATVTVGEGMTEAPRGHQGGGSRRARSASTRAVGLW